MVKKISDTVGRTILTSDGLFDLLLEGKSVEGLLVEENEDTQKYNLFNETDQLVLYSKELQNETIEEYDDKHSQIWKTPKEYKQIDIENWLLSRCLNQIQKDRVHEELNMYEERNLYPLLKHLIFLVEHFRKNDVIWGIGRGSSVASYVLYLIGIHKVDSIKYNLDITEFLR